MLVILAIMLLTYITHKLKGQGKLCPFFGDFDGNKNESAQTYTFNIARYIHKVVQEGYSNRLALYVPISVSQPERVIINNHSVDSVGLRLNLLVSH